MIESLEFEWFHLMAIHSYILSIAKSVYFNMQAPSS